MSTVLLTFAVVLVVAAFVACVFCAIYAADARRSAAALARDRATLTAVDVGLASLQAQHKSLAGRVYAGWGRGKLPRPEAPTEPYSGSDDGGDDGDDVDPALGSLLALQRAPSARPGG